MTNAIFFRRFIDLRGRFAKPDPSFQHKSTTTMAPPSVSSAATAAASTAAAGAVLFMSPLRENSNSDAVPSLPISEATSHRFTLAGTSDAELSALFDAPKQIAGNTAVAIRAVPGQLISLGSKLEDGLRDDLKFFVLFAVSGIVVLATILLVAKYKPSTTGSSKNKKQTEASDFLSPNTTKKLDNLFVSAEMTESIDAKSKDDDSPSNRTEVTDDMTEVARSIAEPEPVQIVDKHPVRDMHTGTADDDEEGHACCPSPIKIDFAGKLSKKKPSKKIDGDLETIGSVTSTASRGLSNKAKLGKYEVTFRSPFKKGVGIRTPLKGKKMN